jgi:NADH-quinone oxidoreductase subunit H
MRPSAAFYALLIAAPLIACQGSDPSSGLLAVSDFSPREAEVGDRLELIGTGFPEGKPATLSFRGDLFRPGREPLLGVEIVAHAQSTSQNRIGFILSEKLQNEICGKGEDADHTTFRGDVTAAFAARTSGAPPVTGTVHDVVLDVMGPAAPPEIVKSREADANRALEFLGIELQPLTSHALATVKQVKPAGPAERAGIQPGDVLVAVDGVSVESLGDIGFAGTTRFAKFAIRRGRLREPIERVVDVQGFKNEPPRELTMAALLVGFVVLLFASWITPIARVFSWVERRVAARLRERLERPKRELAGRLISSLNRSLAEDLTPSDEPVLLRLVPYVLFLGVSAAATLISFGRALVGVDLDLGIALTVSVTALATTRLVAGGWRGPGSWSITRGLGAALAALALQVPLIAGFAAVVLSVGSLRASDLVAAQGAMPWAWHAFENPALFLAFGLVLAASFPGAEPAGELAEADLDPTRRASGLPFYVEWGHLLVVSTLAAILFLGGWKLPLGVPATSGVYYGLFCALALQLKCWCMVGLVLGLRWALPRVRREQVMGVFWRVLLPAAAAIVVASMGFAAWVRSPAVRALTPLMGYVLFGLTLAAILRFVRSVRSHVRSVGAPMHVNPWL